MMRTTISIDDDVADVAQMMARASGQRLGAVISELARRGLRAPVGAQTGVTSAARRFATFDVPTDPKPVSVAAARRAWEESR